MELVVMKEQQAVTSSLQVAESFEKTHKDVLEAFDNLMSQGVAENSADLFWEDKYQHPQNKQFYRVVFMNRDGFSLLAMGFTGKKATQFKLRYITAFNEMEQMIKRSIVPTTIEDMMIYQLEDMKSVKQDVNMLKDTMRISGQQEFEIREKGKNKVVRVLGGKESYAYKQMAKRAFSSFWRQFKRYFSVPRYGELPRVKFDEAIEFIDTWQPETELQMEINYLNRQQKLFGGDVDD